MFENLYVMPLPYGHASASALSPHPPAPAAKASTGNSSHQLDLAQRHLSAGDRWRGQGTKSICTTAV
jgi:hypothetical protein